MLATYFLLEPASPLSRPSLLKPLSFQLFCYRKIIIHLSTMTGCWKTWISDSVGPLRSNQAPCCQLKPMLSDNSFLSLFENCTESPPPVWPSNRNQFPQADPDMNEEENLNIDSFGEGLNLPLLLTTAKTPSSTFNSFTTVQIRRRELRQSDLIFRLTLTVNS